MAAQVLVLAMEYVLPTLGALTISIAGALTYYNLVEDIKAQLESYPGATTTQKRTILETLRIQFDQAFNNSAVISELSFYGVDVVMVRAALRDAIDAELQHLGQVYTFPSFTTIQEATTWYGDVWVRYTQGLVGQDYFDQAITWTNAEITRIATSAAAAVLEPTAPTPTVPTSFPTFMTIEDVQAWFGTVLASSFAGLVTLEYVTAAGTWANAQIALLAIQAQLAGLPVTLPGAGAIAGATTVVIPGFGTAQVTVTVQGQVITGLTPTVPIVQPSIQPIVVSAPDVAIGPTTVNVEAPPAPNVWVTPQLSIGALEASLLTLPLTLSQTLVGALTASAGGMSHAAALGRNACYGSTTAALLANMLPTALGFFSMRALQSDTGIGGWVKDRAADWIDGLVDPRKYTHVETIDDLVDNASKKLRDAMSFGLQAHMWAVLAESNFVLKSLGLGQVAGFMADMAGFQRLAKATIGEVETAALTTPAKYLANQQLRPNIPGMGDLEMMYAKKEIPFNAREGNIGLSQALALQGYSDEWANIYKEHLFMDPRLGEVIRIGQFFSPALVPALAKAPPNEGKWLEERGVSADVINGPDWYFYWRAMKGGYSPADVPIIAETAKRATVRREQTLFLDAATRLVRDGYKTAAQGEVLITEAWALSNPITARLRAIELQQDYKLLQDTKSIIIMSMARGLITRAEAREQLGILGLDGQRVEIEVLKGTLGMLPGMRLEISRPEEVLEEAGMEVE